MKHAACVVMILMMLLSLCAADEALTLSVPETVTGYTEHTITVSCGMPGLLTLEVRNESGLVCRIADAVEVPRGKTSFRWDGLGAWDRPLEKGSYRMNAALTHDGRTEQASEAFRITGNAQSIVMALADADVIYSDGELLGITLRLVRKGRAMIEICGMDAPDKPLAVYRKNIESTKPVVFTWDGSIDGASAEPGEYVIRVYAEENPARVIEIPLTVAKVQDESLMLTGSIMPEGENDIWDAVCAPAVIVNINSGSMASAYREADSRSESVGTVSGQTQCVEVVRTGAVWTQISFWRREDGAPVTGYIQTDKLKIVNVNCNYGLVVDKKTQSMTVYRAGEPLGTLPVSTGSVEYKKLERETPAGSYLIGERANLLNIDGTIAKYAVLFSGSRAIHALAETPEGKSTTGGVATGTSLDEAQLDGYWLWTQIPPKTRLIILDDPAQRNLDVACAQAKVENRAWLKTETAAKPEDGETEVILTLGGDAVIGTREIWMRSADALPAMIAREGMAYPFGGLQQYFADDDMTLINLECVLKADAAGEDKDKLYRFRGLPEYTGVLTAGSVEQVNIANNHHIDYGAAGKHATVEALQAAGIPYSGYGATYICEIGGHLIGFGGCRETTWLQGKQDITAEIAGLRAAGCEVVIYSCHWGEEYNPRHNETQIAMAQAVADAGADVIIGHHPHVVQGVGMISGKPVVYSLGNLMFGGTHELETHDGALARLALRFDSDGYAGAAITMIPLLTSSTPGMNDFRPVQAEGEDALRILAKIQADSAVLIQPCMYFPAR